MNKERLFSHPLNGLICSSVFIFFKLDFSFSWVIRYLSTVSLLAENGIRFFWFSYPCHGQPWSLLATLQFLTCSQLWIIDAHQVEMSALNMAKWTFSPFSLRNCPKAKGEWRVQYQTPCSAKLKRLQIFLTSVLIEAFLKALSLIQEAQKRQRAMIKTKTSEIAQNKWPLREHPRVKKNLSHSSGQIPADLDSFQKRVAQLNEKYTHQFCMWHLYSDNRRGRNICIKKVNKRILC